MVVSWRTRAFVASALVAVQIAGVVGQTTDAVCLPIFNWVFNSQHQSPCVVASSLLAVCNGGPYNVASLPDATHYLGPVSVFDANDCQCNTVVYTMMSACAACQGREYIAWSQWTANCPSVSEGFPEALPTGLHVPGWAYLDPRPSDTFDQLRAQKSINLTESVILPAPTSTSNSVRPTKKLSATSSSKGLVSSTHVSSTMSSSPTPAPSSSTANQSSVPNSHHANMIGGIAIGASVAGLGILGVILWLLHLRIVKKEEQGVRLVSPVDTEPPQLDLEQGPRVIIEEFDEKEDQTHEHMQRYIRATVPAHSPSSSAAGTLPSVSILTNSEPPTPTQATHRTN
ncbi:hypothetical protein P691DRAFT_712638 [Macrolepiota fuliginosa MF-IS2]|uniref:Uncharacterized protein n=1 Tax=Macrolepiota fuliginosa MF-IS2 TaxID=1400762 RepID=A0A9P5X3F9_9AGAR|nr:hypothetical protein P691DRAFT_712638 [Macrolepiota fuliginosa MF-IS2]